MRFRQDENGQVLVLTALCMAVLLGFVALAVDVGILFRAQRNIQIAADAAAIAGALAYEYGPNTATQAADAAAANNGITSSTYVTVSTNPTDGFHQGAGFIEVVIKQPTPTFFMHVFNFSSVTVAARSVAGTIPAPDCIIQLDQKVANGFNVQGSANVNTPHCGIHINSGSQQALCSTGQATITSPSININGYQNQQGNCNGTQQNVHTNSGVESDPFGNLPWLDTVCKPGAETAAVNTSTVLTGGTSSSYLSVPSTTVSVKNSSGQTVTANVTCFNQKNVQLGTTATPLYLGTTPTTDSSGNTNGGNNIYVFENGVSISSNVNISGTMDVQNGNFCQGTVKTGGSCSFSGANALSIYGPANLSDTYNSLALMVDPLDTSISCDPSIKPVTLTTGSNACIQVQFGTGSGNLDGFIYAPNATVYMQDHGGGTVVTGIIAGAIYDKASTLDITASYNYDHPSTTPLSTLAMVE